MLGGGAEAVLDATSRALTAHGAIFVGSDIAGWRAAAGAFASSPPDWHLDVTVVCPDTGCAPLVIAALGALRWRRGD